MRGLTKTWIVECSASLLFTLAYFILLGRTQSSEFSLNMLELSALLAFIYVIAVFVSSFDFDADVFPFYSILRSFFEKSAVPLWLNIPAQMIGTGLGLALYLGIQPALLTMSPVADVATLNVFDIDNLPMRGMLMAVLVFILVYSMIIVRKLFLLTGMTGTLLIAVLVFVLAAITFPIYQLSVVTWWQDILLNFYHYVSEPGRSMHFGWTDVLTGAVLLGIIYLANVKARQYVRSRGDRQEYDEPGEFAPQFSKDYDI